MGAVLVTHGVAPDAQSTRFSTRFRSEPRAFAEFLAQHRFVSLTEALRGEGDALTVDDATEASAEACRMARSAGHPVVLFVNPGQIESGHPYWFMFLSGLCDQLDAPQYDFEGTSYPTATFRQRSSLRSAIKARVSVLPDEAKRREAVMELARRWGIGSLEIPPHARTLTLSELQALQVAGVELHNHGWWHANHLALSGSESAREVRQGRDWLRQRLGVDGGYFAVPFGEPLPSAEAAAWCSVWFLLTEAPIGPVSPTVWNREDVTLYRVEDQREGVSPTPSGLARRAIARLSSLFR